MQNKDIGLTTVGLCSIFLGSMTTAVSGVPLIGTTLNIMGVGSVIIDYFLGKDDHKKFFHGLGLYTNIDGKKSYPKLKEIKNTKYGKSFRFQIPLGISSDDFIKKQTGLHEYFCNGDGSIEFAYNNGFVFMQLHQNRLGDKYEYKPIETKEILEIPIGYSIDGVEFLNIAKSPHVLIAGASGAGKSTIVRSIITYLIQAKSKHGIKLHLMDFKYGVEFAHFSKSSIVKTFSRNVDEAKEVLREINNEADRRYNLFFNTGCKDIEQYNKKHKSKKMDYEVVIIDEFADFYLKDEKDSIILLEELLAKLRACGIHFIISTQRPDSKVINGRIKANTPTVIGLKTKDDINSRIIIDESGLEKLKGEGHALFQFNDKLKEVQCFYLDIDESIKYIEHTYINKDAKFKQKQPTKTAAKSIKSTGKVANFDWLEGGINE